MYLQKINFIYSWKKNNFEDKINKNIKIKKKNWG
jgi:hypothetical protein